MNKMTMIQRMIDALVARSRSYQELKLRSEADGKRIEELESVVMTLTQIVGNLHEFVNCYEELLNEILVTNAPDEMYHDDVLELPEAVNVIDKSKLN